MQENGGSNPLVSTFEVGRLSMSAPSGGEIYEYLIRMILVLMSFSTRFFRISFLMILWTLLENSKVVSCSFLS